MKLLVVSHACVTAVNQAFYADAARLSGWTVDLLIPERWDSEYAKGVEAARWPTFTGEMYRLPVWKPGHVPLHVYKGTLGRVLRAAQPDMIYVHHEPYGLATAQVYLANRCHGSVPIGFYAAQNILKRYPAPFRWLERLVLRHSDFCFPVTEGALEVLEEKGYAGLAEVLPLALDRQVYFPRLEWAEDKRQELQLGAGTFVFGYVGRLVEEKGMDTLLRALAVLQARAPGRAWCCLLVGSGPFEATMRALVAELGLGGRVRFEGFVPHEEVPGWLTLFDVLALPSETRANWKEQFGRVIVEANACETAVIGSDSGEVARVLHRTGGGMVVPERDPGRLADAMEELLLDPARTRKLALQGAAEARRFYDQERLARRFVDVLRQAHGRAAMGERG